ncbi:hypothetical protein C2W64_02042 [Brevibacillus laterosporus]|nr:hypothetical protein [Brevibacillus laterosporus]RAP26210.1 hypothetical protein C2W64_02042 [Brevibacillus laterosporus]
MGKLFDLLGMSATTLKQALDSGKSIFEIAASKNISKQQVLDVIVEASMKDQIEFDKKEGFQTSPDLSKDLNKKVEHVLDGSKK